MLLIAGTAMFGRAYADTDVTRSAVESVDTKVDRILDRDLTKVSFSPHSSELSQTDKAALTALVQKAAGDANVDRFVVAAWSDHDFPADDTKLSKAQQDLATQRRDHVEKVLKDAGATTVDAYSMAERPSWIAKVFNMESAEIKGQARGSSEKDREYAAIGRKLRAKGGPDTAVVILFHKSDVAH